MIQGTTLLLPTGDKSHLFIALTDSHSHPPYQVLLVSVCTFDDPKRQDATCVLHAGDHDFIKTKSYVNYNFARVENLAPLERGLANGVITDRGPLDSHLLDAVIDGLRTSTQTKPFAIQFIDDFS